MIKDKSRSKENCHKYAIELLKLIYGENFYELKDIDSPDLQDKEKGIGIEVTKAVDYKIEETLTAFLQKKMKRKDVVKFNDSCFIQFKEECVDEKINQIKNSYLDKVNKLNNGNYDTFKEVSLLIFTSLHQSIDLDSISKIFKTDKEKNFKYVYLVAYNNFYEFDLENKTNKLISYINNGKNYKAIVKDKVRFFWF